MGVQDLWYLKKRGPNKKKLRSKRYGRGQRWRVNWTDPNTGETPSLSFDTETEAETKWAEILLSLTKGTYTDPKAGRRLTVDDYIEEWLGQLVVRESSEDAVAGRARNHVSPVLGKKLLGQVRSGAIKAWIRDRQQLAKPLSASTIRTIYHTVIHPMFAQAVIDDRIPKTPCVGIKLPELPVGEYDLPTAEQVHAIADAIDGRYRAAVYLAAGCGWRTSEIFGALHDPAEPAAGSLDFLRREAHVRHQIREPRGGGHCLAPPKSKTSRRTTELPEVTANELAQHIKLYPPTPMEIRDRTNPDEEVIRLAHMLFTDERGVPMRRNDWSRIWSAATDEAKLPRGMFTLTSLRHFFVTTLIFGGKNIKTVQKAAGHATPTITLNTYLGYWPDDERHSTRDLLNGALSQVRTGSVPEINS